MFNKREKQKNQRKMYKEVEAELKTNKKETKEYMPPAFCLVQVFFSLV